MAENETSVSILKREKVNMNEKVERNKEKELHENGTSKWIFNINVVEVQILKKICNIIIIVII